MNSYCEKTEKRNKCNEGGNTGDPQLSKLKIQSLTHPQLSNLVFLPLAHFQSDTEESITI